MFQKIEINSSTYGIGEVSKTESDEVNETADEAFNFPVTLTSSVFQVSLCKNRRHEASEAASFLNFEAI